MPVDDLVAPEIVEIGQQDGAVGHRRMHVAVDGALGDHHHSIAVLAIASTGGGTANDCATMRAMSSPDKGSTSSLLRLASSRKPGSRMVATKALRIAAARSGGVDGGMKNGRPSAGTSERNSSTWRCSSLRPSSGKSGLSVSSGAL